MIIKRELVSYPWLINKSGYIHEMLLKRLRMLKLKRKGDAGEGLECWEAGRPSLPLAWE